MDGVDELIDKLNSTWQEISTKIYQKTEEGNPDPEMVKDEVTDVDYEEVK